MTKEEMKNKISMALKDPILQQGFEIICKNLAELEKENEQLKEQTDKMKCCANCKFGNPGEYDCFENCSSCTVMNCICDKTGKEMDWEEKCDNWELAELPKVLAE